MADDTLTPWQEYREACAYAAEAAAEYWRMPSGDRPDAWDYAHETADGAACVIYTGRAMDIYAATSEVRDFESDATEGCDGDADISRRVTLTVYSWLAAEIEQAIRSTEPDEDEDEDEDEVAA